MTTDNFTEAARAYAEQACYQDENRPIAEAGFRAGWKAARTHLAAQNEAAIRALATTTAHTGQDIVEAARIMRDVAQEPTDADRRFGPRATAVIREWTGAHPAEDREPSVAPAARRDEEDR